MAVALAVPQTKICQCRANLIWHYWRQKVICAWMKAALQKMNLQARWSVVSASQSTSQATPWYAPASATEAWVKFMSSVSRSGSTASDSSMRGQKSLHTSGKLLNVSFARSHSRIRCGVACLQLCSLTNPKRTTWYWSQSRVLLRKLCTFST